MTGTNMAPHSGEAPEIPEELDRGITLPVNVKIEADHKVYDLSEAKVVRTLTDVFFNGLRALPRSPRRPARGAR